MTTITTIIQNSSRFISFFLYRLYNIAHIIWVSFRPDGRFNNILLHCRPYTTGYPLFCKESLILYDFQFLKLQNKEPNCRHILSLIKRALKESFKISFSVSSLNRNFYRFFKGRLMVRLYLFNTFAQWPNKGLNSFWNVSRSS